MAAHDLLPARDTVEFAAAFALGVVLGAGFAMLARSESRLEVRTRTRRPGLLMAGPAHSARQADTIRREPGGSASPTRELLGAVREEASRFLQDTGRHLARAAWLRRGVRAQPRGTNGEA